MTISEVEVQSSSFQKLTRPEIFNAQTAPHLIKFLRRGAASLAKELESVAEDDHKKRSKIVSGIIHRMRLADLYVEKLKRRQQESLSEGGFAAMLPEDYPKISPSEAKHYGKAALIAIRSAHKLKTAEAYRDARNSSFVAARCYKSAKMPKESGEFLKWAKLTHQLAKKSSGMTFEILDEGQAGNAKLALKKKNQGNKPIENPRMSLITAHERAAGKTTAFRKSARAYASGSRIDHLRAARSMFNTAKRLKKRYPGGENQDIIAFYTRFGRTHHRLATSESLEERCGGKKYKHILRGIRKAKKKGETGAINPYAVAHARAGESLVERLQEQITRKRFSILLKKKYPHFYRFQFHRTLAGRSLLNDASLGDDQAEKSLKRINLCLSKSVPKAALTSEGLSAPSGDAPPQISRYLDASRELLPSEGTANELRTKHGLIMRRGGIFQKAGKLKLALGEFKKAFRIARQLKSKSKKDLAARAGLSVHVAMLKMGKAQESTGALEAERSIEEIFGLKFEPRVIRSDWKKMMRAGGRAVRGAKRGLRKIRMGARRLARRVGRVAQRGALDPLHRLGQAVTKFGAAPIRSQLMHRYATLAANAETAALSGRPYTARTAAMNAQKIAGYISTQDVMSHAKDLVSRFSKIPMQKTKMKGAVLTGKKSSKRKIGLQKSPAIKPVAREWMKPGKGSKLKVAPNVYPKTTMSLGKAMLRVGPGRGVNIRPIQGL